MIEIKSISGRVLYTAQNATDVRSAVIEAVAAKADLRYADLRSADLRSADLGYANLRSADLGSANLYYADLGHADLRSADLGYADLRHADLRSADLRSADLGYANLYYADLGHADLRSADLGSANLDYADLRYADLGYAENADLAIAQTRILPDEGPVIGWKKARDGRIVKLRIPSKADRSHAGGRKCRSSQAKVLAIYNPDGTAATEAFSTHDADFRYAVGEIVTPTEPFDPDMWNECASGIHWYITRAEAEAHA